MLCQQVPTALPGLATPPLRKPMVCNVDSYVGQQDPDSTMTRRDLCRTFSQRGLCALTSLPNYFIEIARCLTKAFVVVLILSFLILKQRIPFTWIFRLVSFRMHVKPIAVQVSWGKCNINEELSVYVTNSVQVIQWTQVVFPRTIPKRKFFQKTLIGR